MAGGAALLADRRQMLADCAESLRDLHNSLFQCASSELRDLVGDLAELRALCGAQLVAVVAEAESRGIIAESQYASTSAWVADAAWHSRRESATLAKAARLLHRNDLEPVAHAVLTVDLDPATAVSVATEFDKLAPDLRDDAKPLVLEQFLTVAAEQGPNGVRQLEQEILACYGENGEFDDHQDRCRRQIDLSPGRESSAGVWDYRFTTDNEGRAVLEAAIGPLSAPQPNQETGETDPRPAGRRRGEALIEALRRSVTATEHVPTSPKAVLMLTMSHDDLAAQAGAATAVGSRAADTLLSPHTVRRIACDAGIIPAVLGGDGEILNQGRTQRLFTTAQVRALWLRDRHCTFGGCTIPAAWTDAHHLTHWIDGGPTDLGNGALLCPRHHTIVHRDRLAGTVTADGVCWDRRPDSYRPPGRPWPPGPSGPSGTPPPAPPVPFPRRPMRVMSMSHKSTSHESTSHESTSHESTSAESMSAESM